MNQKNPRPRAVVVLLVLAAVAVAVWAAVWLAGDRISFTDDTVDIEVVAPAAPRST